MRSRVLAAARFLATLAVPIVLQAQPPLALVGARIYPAPGQRPIRDGVVVIDGARIAALGERRTTKVPRGARVLYLAGLTMTAGLWNSHAHFIEAKWSNAAKIPAAELGEQIEEMLTSYGFVHVFDTGSPLENTNAIRRRVETGEVVGPAIHTAGMVLFPKGGTPPATLTLALGFMPGEYPEVGSTQQAIDWVGRMLDGGADAIKLYAETWFGQPVAMPLEIVQAIVAETHRRGKLVLAHPSDKTGLGRSVEAGVDVLVHTAPEAGPWSGDRIATMKAKRIALIPTLKLWRYETRHTRRSLVQGFIDLGVAQLRAYSAAGGTILFGTDVGYMGDYDPTEEYELMARAGLDFSRILASLTTAPAERFGLSDRTGRLAPAMDADIVVFRADPAVDPKAFAAVRYAFRKGAIIYQAK